MQSRNQASDTANVFPVAIIWLIFYAIMITGAVTGPWPVPETLAIATAIDGVH
jgi:hypothetical protein